MLDSFSGQAATLPKGKRTPLDVLACLAEHPRLSGWDLSETRWLHDAVRTLQRQGLIAVDLNVDAFPWVRYRLTDAGKAALEKK